MSRAARRILDVPEWAWVALALALRLAFVLKLGGRLYQIDEAGYDAGAWNLASTGDFGLPWGVPLPIAFFSVFYLAGHHVILPRLAQAFVGAAIPWLVGRMTRDISGSAPAGRLALALSSIYPFFIYYSGLLLSETMYLACIVPALWALCRSLRDGGRTVRLPAAAGSLLAAAALCRVEAAPIAVLLWALTAAAGAARRWPWKSWALALLCWALPLSVWCARNKTVAGRFTLDIHGGITLLHGTLLFDYNEIDTEEAGKALQAQPFYKEAAALSPAERNSFYIREGLRFMREHPETTLKQWGRKLVNFWRFYPRTNKAYHETAASSPGVGLGRGALIAISLLFEPALIALGLAGLWSLRTRAETWPLWLFLMGTMGLHMVSVSQMRYRLPVMPLLILGTCVLLAEGQSQKR